MSKKYRIKETGVEVVQRQKGYYRVSDTFVLDDSDIKDLGLTLEEITPVQKKLYAYKLGSEVYFSIDNDERSSRVPEFDITFPSEDEK